MLRTSLIIYRLQLNAADFCNRIQVNCYHTWDQRSQILPDLICQSELGVINMSGINYAVYSFNHFPGRQST